MSQFDLFTADALAKHKDWKCLTSAKKRAKTHRRLFVYTPNRRLYGRVAISDTGLVFSAGRQSRQYGPIPETYAGFIRLLKFQRVLNSGVLLKPNVFKGWDGANLTIRVT